MYKAFIEPDLETAHIKIRNKFNPFTGFQNPMYILKVGLTNIFFCRPCPENLFVFSWQTVLTIEFFTNVFFE
jgi:hypothetical protein